jgi:hypothetical protein
MMLDNRDTEVQFGRVNNQLELFHEVSKVVDYLSSHKADAERLSRLEHAVENEYTRMDNYEENKTKTDDVIQ